MSNKEKECEDCYATAIKGARFCKECQKELIDKLKAEGYLRPAPHKGPAKYRGPEARENTRETWHGKDQG